MLWDDWYGAFPRHCQRWKNVGSGWKQLVKESTICSAKCPTRKGMWWEAGNILKASEKAECLQGQLDSLNSVKPWELSADSLIKIISFLVCSIYFSSRILVQSKNIYYWVDKVYWHFENHGNSLSTTRFIELQKNPIIIFQEMYTLQLWPPSL